jgi:hypothetical protein
MQVLGFEERRTVDAPQAVETSQRDETANDVSLQNRSPGHEGG